MIDKQTFVKWIERQSPTCYRVARSILCNHEDCKDAVQEAVAKAWAARHRLRDESLFATWFTRILIHECRNIQRKGNKYVLLPEVTPTEATEPFARSDAWEVLDALPDKLRLPLVLHHMEGYSMQEISIMLRLPQSTIRGRLYQARKAMRMELTEGSELIYHDA